MDKICYCTGRSVKDCTQGSDSCCGPITDEMEETGNISYKSVQWCISVSYTKHKTVVYGPFSREQEAVYWAKKYLDPITSNFSIIDFINKDAK